jgi:hypothetical protein
MGDLGPPGRRRTLRRTAGVGVAAAALVLGIAGPAAAAEASSYGVDVNVTVTGSPAVDVGPLVASSVGDSPNTVASITAGGLVTSGTVTTSATANAGTGGFTSNAAVEDLGITIATLAIGAGAVSATCTATQAGNTGTVSLTGLTASLAGLNIAIPGTITPNTRVAIAVGLIRIGTLTLNEQIVNADGGLTVNAIHLSLLGGVLGSIAAGDVVVSSATCGPAVLPVPLASGAGLVLGLGLVAMTGGSWYAVHTRRRNRRVTAAAA